MKLPRFALVYLGLCTLTSLTHAADLLPPGKPIPEVIDHYIDLQLKEQEITPAPQADDLTFIRRVTLDLCGRIPTSSEILAYVSSKSANKKTELVDRLMATNGYLRHQVTEYDTMLAPMESGKRRGGQGSLREYLTRVVKENRSWDKIFRDLILAEEKDPATKGSSVFLKSRVKDLDRLTTDVSVLFFGVNISCAQCHDHPLVHDWKQDHYYGLKSFFNRTFEAGQFLGERDTGVVQFKTTKNVNKVAKLMFLTGKVVDDPAAKPLSPDELKKAREKEKSQRRGKTNGGSQPPAPKWSARSALADLALQPDQRSFFSRAIVNRLWHRFFGLGLINPIDQMHSENIASHPELLQWLARDMAENGYDLRRLTRGLILSRAYGRSSRYEGDRFPAARTFAVARLRAMTPMQYALSLRIATTDPDQFPATLKAEELDRRLENLEGSVRGFASMIEQPHEDFQISVSEALLFSNSDRILREFLGDSKDRLIGRLKEMKSTEQAIDLAVRTVLGRTPSEEEKKAMLDYVASRQDRITEAYKQMTWALLSSAEFRFNY